VSNPAYAARVERIRTSPSLAAAARARELSAAGRAVLDLTLGEPDFDTPRHIKDAAIAAIEAGQTKYTPVNGTPDLRQAIIAHLEKRTGIRYGDAQITVSSGAKQIIYLALAATLDGEGEVIIPAPYWVSYPDMVLANDGKPVIIPCPATDGFLLTPEKLDAAIGPRTRWVMLNTPSNPAGAAYSAGQLRALANILLAYPQVGVLADEIYDAIYFGTDMLHSIVSIEPRLADRTLVVNGVSKAYAMTGWRIGYAAGPAGLIAAMNKLQGQISTCPSSISQAAAVAALEGDQSPVFDMVNAYRRRRDLAVELLGTVPGLTVVPPAGAFYLFPHCGALLGRRTCDETILRTDEDVTLYLLDAASVATVHGAAYGLSPHFRVSYAISENILENAITRIAAAVADLR
jgi:aspartate aminotransferase